MLLIEFPSSRRLNFHAQGCNILPNNNSYAATALSTNDRSIRPAASTRRTILRYIFS